MLNHSMRSKRNPMYKVIAIVLLLVSPHVMAQKFCATFDLPGKRENNSCLAYNEVQGIYIKYWYFNGDKKITKKTKLTRNKEQCVSIDTTAPVTFQAFTVDTKNIESKGSNTFQVGIQ